MYFFSRRNRSNFPFKNGYFDVVWCSGVLHHTPDPKEAFQSIARKVKTGGRLFVSVYGKDLHHYRVFRHLLPFARRLPSMSKLYHLCFSRGPIVCCI